MEEVLVFNCLYCKEPSYGRQHKGRYELSHEGSGGAVAGKPLSRDVYDPVQHEEQQGNDRRGSQTALFQDSPNRSAYEKQQQAGQRLGILFPHLHIRAVDHIDVVIGVVCLAPGNILILPCCLKRPLKGPLTVFEAFEIALFRYGQNVCGLLPPRGVQLLLVCEAVVFLEVPHVLHGTLVHEVHKGIVAVLELLEVHGLHLFSVAGGV